MIKQTTIQVATEMKKLIDDNVVTFDYLYKTQFHVLQAKYFPNADLSVISTAISWLMEKPEFKPTYR
jgi:hypothetical protein